MFCNLGKGANVFSVNANKSNYIKKAYATTWYAGAAVFRSYCHICNNKTPLIKKSKSKRLIIVRHTMHIKKGG